MLGNIVQKLQSLSPLTSPVTSPVASPRASRRAAQRRLRRREEFREVQSEPEEAGVSAASGRARKRSPHHQRIEQRVGNRLGPPSAHCRSSHHSTHRTYHIPNHHHHHHHHHHHRPERRKEEQPSAPISFGLLQESKSLGRLEGLKEIQRLAQYEQYIESVFNESNYEEGDSQQAKDKEFKSVLAKGEEETDLERIQDIFPNDALCLHEKDAHTMCVPLGTQKMKGLVRKRSIAASRIQRVLSSKPQRDAPGPSASSQTGSSSPTESPVHDRRHFIMESPVQFTTGVQSQDRHLFLFNDLLLVAKARSGGNFKLKDKVRVSDMWLCLDGIDELIEVPRSSDTSFVVGWPTTNIVATFSTKAARDQWFSKLTEVIASEREKEPTTTNIQVIYYDPSIQVEYCKTFTIGPTDTAKHCIRIALEHLGVEGLNHAENIDEIIDDFQLWAKSGHRGDGDSPYPLMGHERPFAVKLHCLRQGLSTEEGFDLDHCNNLYGTDPFTRCQFLLRSKKLGVVVFPSDGKASSKKKNRKSPIRIRQVFRRSLSSKGEENVDGNISTPGSSARSNGGVLFGIPLSRIIDTQIPKAVKVMLMQVFLKGPATQGIFRKSANARLVRELREKIDSGEDVQLEHVPVLATAALLKDFLRSLPDPLLCAHLFPEWMSALSCPDTEERISSLRSVVEMLPPPNLLLLKHFLCVLHHISIRSRENLMSASNLGVCVGPSLLWVPSLTPTSTRTVPVLVSLLIEHCEALCGPRVASLLGEFPDKDIARLDSGAEESDSLHSGGGLRRDDSSIDSLERELLEPSPPPRKDKMSLSRDSGLTMSDTQLYTPDEEETGSTSGGSGGRALFRPQINCPLPSISSSSSSTPSTGSSPSFASMQQYSHNNPNVLSNYHAKDGAALSTPSPSQVLPVNTPSPMSPRFRSENQRDKVKVSCILEEPKNYVRVYAGWDERMECFRKGCDDSVYAKPVARHTQSHGGQYQVINPNFQRQDWFRQRSHLKRLASKQNGQTSCGSSTSSGSSSSSSGTSACGARDSKNVRQGPNQMMVHLRRSASEESLPRATYGLASGMREVDKRAVVQSKGQAVFLKNKDEKVADYFGKSLPRRQSHPQSPLSQTGNKQLHARRHTSIVESNFCSKISHKTDNEVEHTSSFHPVVAIPRSKSAHHLSASTNSAVVQMPVASYQSRSNEDWSRSLSTPHIASGSCQNQPSNGGVDEADRSYDSSTLSDDDSTPHVSRSNSRGKDCHSSAPTSTWENIYSNVIATQPSIGSLPSYEETMSRRMGPQSELVRAAPAVTIDATAIDDSDLETPKSDESVDNSHPPPPPLPPKLRKGGNNVSASGSSEVSPAGKLRHLPPVHVMYPSSSASAPRLQQLLYVNVSQSSEKKMDTEMDTGCCSPAVYTSDRGRSTAGASEKFKNKTSLGVSQNGESDEVVPRVERRSRPGRREGGASQRSKSLPPADSNDVEKVAFKDEVDGLQKSKKTSQVVASEFRGEINWSVSHLRSLFSCGKQKGWPRKEGTSGPPPYRPPPSFFPSYRTPITNLHFATDKSEETSQGTSNDSQGKISSKPIEEESYV